MAYILGDSTAKQDGRLSLNPIRHIDPVGLVCILLIGFGWAKPVMIDTRNLKNPKIDMALISIAGPISNFVMAFLGMILLYALFLFTNAPAVVTNVLGIFCMLNIMLGVFNLLPIPPLDGSKVLAGMLPDAIYNNLPPMGGRFGMLILLVFIFTGLTARVLIPLTGAINSMMATVVGRIFGMLL